MYEYIYDHTPIRIVSIDTDILKISFDIYIITTMEVFYEKSQKKISMSTK
jgi:hypothetical protein